MPRNENLKLLKMKISEMNFNLLFFYIFFHDINIDFYIFNNNIVQKFPNTI